jgi:hypothetical protein
MGNMQITYSNIVAGNTIQLPIRDITSAISINWGDGSATQTVNQWESIQLICYAADKWGVL